MDKKPKIPIEVLAKELLSREQTNQRLNNTLDTAGNILKLVAAGAFVVGGLVAPNLPKLAKPLIRDLYSDEPWERFNIPYLKRKLKRLEKQKLVKFRTEGKKQVVEITSAGRRRILKFSLAEMTIPRPRIWSGRWWLVTYDIPGINNRLRREILSCLKNWGFYPLEQSVYLHAYPCEKEISFLREFLGVGEYLRIFDVARIENDQIFRDFFGI